tara:strand:- start:819 stop:1031 length:213 start_codon:yes stop_codon:yes gene_type:complete
MSDSLFDQGLLLMAAGMGSVFVFLTLLVVAMVSMARIVEHFLPKAAPAGDDNFDAEVAAISAAIRRHRER